MRLYSYDATGNRLSAKVGSVTHAYTYPTTNHRLSAVAGVARTYDKTGNTLSIGGKAREFPYDASGRMSLVKRAGAVVMNYRYNGKGEQVRRFLGTTNTYTLYDEAGHWLGDYDTNGVPKQQAIWLDDLPVGLLANANTLHYIEPDHLGSPRVVIDPTRDVAVWTWSLKGEAFGNTAPNQDPDSDGAALVLDMRFPGQRFDAASGLNQNYLRDYDPATGRYAQSDPIGLLGGLSTFSYAGSSSLEKFDVLDLMEGSLTNLQKRNAISSWAMQNVRSTAYGFYQSRSTQYPANSWKCSSFVCDAASNAGAPTTVTIRGKNDQQIDRCATAVELAKGYIPNWRQLGKYEERMPGDIAANRNAGPNSTGHTAIVVPGVNGGVTTMGAHDIYVGPAGVDQFPEGSTVLRYIGD